MEEMEKTMGTEKKERVTFVPNQYSPKRQRVVGTRKKVKVKTKPDIIDDSEPEHKDVYWSWVDDRYTQEVQDDGLSYRDFKRGFRICNSTNEPCYKLSCHDKIKRYDSHRVNCVGDKK